MKNVNPDIWKKFLQGNKEAFAQIYNAHVNALFRYGTKFCYDENLVKDAIHEVFLDLYLKRKKNKTTPENLRWYLMLAVKRNLIKKLIQNRKLETEDEFKFEPEYSIEKIIIESEKEDELNKRVNNMLKNLPARQKEAVYLRYNESMEYEDIAKIMNISIESVRKQIYRAISSLRNKYGQSGLILFMLKV